MMMGMMCPMKRVLNILSTGYDDDYRSGHDERFLLLGTVGSVNESMACGKIRSLDMSRYTSCSLEDCKSTSLCGSLVYDRLTRAAVRPLRSNTCFPAKCSSFKAI